MAKQKKIKCSCKRATRMIPDFIEKKLSYQDMESFMNHMESCESCREELSIQFLVSVGLNSLEAGNNFDLQSELEETLSDAYRKVKMHHFLKQTVMALEIISIISLVIISIMVVLL